jgi:colanic acid/amylovoran biosynthesis glycosyltransferase
VIYTDSLFAMSETFVSGLISLVAEQESGLEVLTHRVCDQRAAPARVTVLPRYFPRGTARWLVTAAARRFFGVELFEGALRRHMTRHRFAVAHAQFGQPGYFMWRALEAAGAPKPRLIVNFYGYDATGLLVDAPEWRGRYWALFAYKELAVVVEGPVMKSRLAALGCPEEKIHVVPLCLDVSAAELESPYPAPRQPRSGDGPVLGMAGRMVEKKGFAFALRHLAPVLKAHRDTKVVVVGDGPQRAEIEALIAQQGLGRQVKLKGMLPYTDLLEEVRAWDALLVPSLTAANGDGEGGAPTIVAEAQILGTPVIASDHADIPFSLFDHSYMFKEGDDRSLAETVTRFVRDLGAAYDAGQARVRTLERHDRRAIGARYAALYRGAP